jgi:hypothetical protein
MGCTFVLHAARVEHHLHQLSTCDTRPATKGTYRSAGAAEWSGVHQSRPVEWSGVHQSRPAAGLDQSPCSQC